MTGLPEGIRFSHALAHIRRKRGLTQRSLALTLGVSVDSVRAWENRRRTPSFWNLMRLCRVLRVQIADLV